MCRAQPTEEFEVNENGNFVRSAGVEFGDGMQLVDTNTNLSFISEIGAAQAPCMASVSISTE